MNLRSQIEVAAAQRDLCSAVAGTDVCVSGGPFACMCNKCNARYHEIALMLKELFDELYNV